MRADVLVEILFCTSTFVVVVKTASTTNNADRYDEMQSFIRRFAKELDESDYTQPLNYNGSRSWNLNCEQGTVMYPRRPWKCKCKKDYALYDHEKCARAWWSSWSSWTKCLKSDWGGLQRRERICESRGREAPGACNGKGSMARTCTPVTKEFKIRKNIRHLTKEEFHDILQAMTKFKKDKTKHGYRNIISWHGYPGRCPWYKHIKDHCDRHCSWHQHPMFLPWHRLITIQLELGLSRYLKNKTLGIPFWDWTEHSQDIPYLIRHPQIYDPMLKKYIKNPFFTTFIKYLRHEKVYSRRNIWYPGLLMDRYLLKGTVRALLCHDYAYFDLQESRVPHNQIHDCFCLVKFGKNEKNPCRYGMPTVKYAAWDPVFLLHHSAMDRVFVARRKLEESNGVADWTRSRVIGQYTQMRHFRKRDVIEAFDWPLSPFCNISMNPEPVTGKEMVWTMHNAYYDEQLFGYKYDNFNFGHNYTWEDLQRDFKANVMMKKFWNDEYFVTKLGDLTRANSKDLKMTSGCAKRYSNPKWEMSIKWK